MKILYLNHNIKGEGTYFRAFNFAKHLIRFGHDITLITVSADRNFTSKQTLIDGVKIIEAPKFLDQHRGGWAPLDIVFRILHCLKYNYDIIHGFDHKPNVSFPIFFAKLFKKKSVIIFDWADWWTKGGIASASRLTPEILIETFLEEYVRKISDYNTVTSKALEARALKIGIKRKNLFYIPSGCDTENIRPLSKPSIAIMRKKLGIPVKKKIFEFIGFGQGDVDILINAFNIVRAKNGNCLLLIVGPLEKNLEKKITNSPFCLDIISTGRVPYIAIPSYVGIADICLLPLRDNLANRGRGPIKAGDYMAAGKPIIANPVGDIEYFIKKYKVGILAGFTTENFADAMHKMISNPSIIRDCSKNSEKVAKNILGWNIVSKDMEKIYSMILNKIIPR